jgi:hypothetical protein
LRLLQSLNNPAATSSQLPSSESLSPQFPDGHCGLGVEILIRLPEQQARDTLLSGGEQKLPKKRTIDALLELIVPFIGPLH